MNGYKATHHDPTTTALRAAGWYPTGDEPCGCKPTGLCIQHREIRAVEHYHPGLIS